MPDRVYVRVTSDFDPTGYMLPCTITWPDGRVFRIDSIRDFRPAASLEEGRRGDCYTVIIQGEEKRLFFERSSLPGGGRLGRWWVERAARSM